MAGLKKQLKDFKTIENSMDGNEYVFVSQNGNTRKTTINDVKKFTIGTEDMGTSATTIKGAIKEDTTQLKDNTKQLNDFTLTFEMFGAKGDGVTDDTQSFVQALETGKIFELKQEKEMKKLKNEENINIITTFYDMRNF